MTQTKRFQLPVGYVILQYDLLVCLFGRTYFLLKKLLTTGTLELERRTINNWPTNEFSASWLTLTSQFRSQISEFRGFVFMLSIIIACCPLHVNDISCFDIFSL